MKAQGNRALITFTGIGGGLTAKDANGELKGFDIAGPDRIFYPAKAVIEGDKVAVYSDKIVKPAAVRFGWSGDASADNLFNKEGFPAAPFRTDDWFGITEGVKFEIQK